MPAMRLRCCMAVLMAILAAAALRGVIAKENHRRTHSNGIRPLPCQSRISKTEGICMFAWNCMTQKGTHLSPCFDGIFIGSCCKLPPEVSSTVEHNEVLQPIVHKPLPVPEKIKPANPPITNTTPGLITWRPHEETTQWTRPTTTMAPTVSSVVSVSQESSKPVTTPSVLEIVFENEGTTEIIYNSTQRNPNPTTDNSLLNLSPVTSTSIVTSVPVSTSAATEASPTDDYTFIEINFPETGPTVMTPLSETTVTSPSINVTNVSSSSIDETSSIFETSSSTNIFHGSNVTDEISTVMQTDSPIITTIPPLPTTRSPLPTTISPVPITIEPTTLRPRPTTRRPTTRRPITTSLRPRPTTSQRPRPTTRRPIVTSQRPRPTTRKPLTTSQRPRPTTRRPITTSQRPRPTTKRPIITSQRPRPTTQIPTTTTSPLTTTVASTTTTTVQTATRTTTDTPISTTIVPLITSEPSTTTTSTTTQSTTSTGTSTTAKPSSAQPVTTTTTTSTTAIPVSVKPFTTIPQVTSSTAPLPIPPVTPTTAENKTQDYKEVCGRPNPGPQARIVGGIHARYAEWPWMISLRQMKKNTFLHKCGAALLNEFWAITAAHCVESVSPGDLLLRLGEYDISNEKESEPYDERRVQIIASHPKFDPRTFEYDLALLRFYEPVQFRRNILPICVPEGRNAYVGKMATVTGWGRLYEDGPLPNIMQQVHVPVLTNNDCEKMYRKAGFVEDIPDIFICSGFGEGGKDSCEGDSGGPMVLKDGNRWVLAGIISWGIGCALPNQPGVYSRITKFSDWINQIISF